jgi:hypothetical protein
LEQLNTLFKTVLRDNVPDPLNRGVTWIFYGYPRDKIRYPSISVFQSTSSGGLFAIGDTRNTQEVLYLIEVVTNKEAAFTEGTERYSAYKLLVYLTDKIAKAIMNNRDYARTQGLEDWNVSRMETLGYDPERDEYKQRIWVSCIGVLEL